MAAGRVGPAELLAGLWAKSPKDGSGPELLTEHSVAVRDRARTLASRVGPAGVLDSWPRFWAWVEWAALLHDAGKVAAGFQKQLRTPRPWGERHEVLSLAYVDLFFPDVSGEEDEDRAMVAAGVGFHHRPLAADGALDASTRQARDLLSLYPPDGKDWKSAFGVDPARPSGQRAQVTPDTHAALTGWLTGQLDRSPVPPPGDRKLWQRTRRAFEELRDAWLEPVDPESGLRAVLLQGAVTLADHAGSAHVDFKQHMPLHADYLRHMEGRGHAPYPHQREAVTVDGHLVLTAPTAAGKTEAGLAWAGTQVQVMPGQPRLVWVLPYRASINAARRRFMDDLVPTPGEQYPDIAVLHASTAQTLLRWATHTPQGERTSEPEAAAEARKARARAGAMRLFAQRVRVSTPHQLLRAACAGPKYSSLLVEQAGSVFVLDELHAYDPSVFGRLCACMRLWERLGSRVAVTSATLAPPVIDLIVESLTAPAVISAPRGTAPVRHRLSLDEEPVTSEANKQRILGWIREGHSVLVVANTVATAQRLYKELAPRTREILPGDPDAAVLLHSRFKTGDRDKIEERILDRYPEREPGEPAMRRPGLVVSTQALEVSLCLDFDRGAVEGAPVEAVAQRAGRVNRRGRHPDGPVELRVHRPRSAEPYTEDAVRAAWDALAHDDGAGLSEEAVQRWLDRAYATDWGQGWLHQARAARDEFERGFLTYSQPFHDRDGYAAALDRDLDGVEVLLAGDAEEYRERCLGPDGDRLLGAGLLIPLRYGHKAQLHEAGRCAFNEDLGVHLVEAPYDSVLGLDLRELTPAEPEVDTVL